MANQTIDTLSIKISATSSSAVKNLQNTAKAVKKVGNASNGAIPKMKKLDGGVLGLARSFGKFYASCFLLIRGIKALGKAIGKSMDYIETYNYFSVTLDKVAKESMGNFDTWGYESAEEYAESFSSRLNELTEKMTGFSVGEDGMLSQSSLYGGLGVDPERLMNFQAQIMQLTNSVGELGETSLNTTKALSMLASDLSSFTNRDIEQVMSNLQSGLIGQSRALYKYGIDITQASLEQEALTQGISKSVSEMSQAEKMQLRLLVILRNSRVAWGDQANTINSVANQYRIMKEQTSNLARIIGNLFLPIVQKVLPVVNGLIIALQRLFMTLGAKIFGDNWSNIMDGISGGVGDIDDGSEDFADNMDSAEKSAKKLKQHLMGIDELNVLSDSNGAGSSAVGGLDLSSQIAEALSEYEIVWNDALSKAKNKAVEIANALEKIFSSTDTLLGNILYTAGYVTSAFGQGVVGGIKQANDGLKVFNDERLNSIGQSYERIKGALDRILEPIRQIGDIFKGEAFQGIVKTLAEIADILFMHATDKGLGFLSDLIDFASLPIAATLQDLVDILDETTTAVDNLLEPFSIMMEYLSPEVSTYNESSLHKFFTDAKEMYPLIQNMSLLNFTLKETKWAMEKLNELWEKLDINGKVTKVVKHVKNSLVETRTHFVAFGKNVKEALLSAWDSVISGLKDLWNKFANFMNQHLTWNIDPVVILGQTVFPGASISLGRIPTFATGGFPEDGLFMANHGEMVGQFSNGKNAVVNNQQIVDGISIGVERAVASSLVPYLRDISANTGKTADKEFSVNIGDRDIARANIRGQRSMGMVLRTT